MKAKQDQQIPLTDHYIWHVIEFQDRSAEQDEDDEDDSGEPLRIIICLSREGSIRMRDAQYIQSDTGFKCIIGFFEFELAALDQDANTSMSFSSRNG